MAIEFVELLQVFIMMGKNVSCLREFVLDYMYELETGSLVPNFYHGSAV